MSLFLANASAEIKDLMYDGKEIYVHVQKDHMTTIIFPEAIIGIIRGFGADTFVVKRNNKKTDTLVLMPTDLETAEMTVNGHSGEEYVLRFLPNADFYTKLTIRRMAPSLDKDENKIVTSRIDTLAPSILENQEALGKPSSTPTTKEDNHSVSASQENPILPPELNLKVTLKGNDLPLKIYLATIAQVTHYNVITTPAIDSQKTSINLEGIEVWRALKSLLYKFGYGFKVSQEDLIIT